MNKNGSGLLASLFLGAVVVALTGPAMAVTTGCSGGVCSAEEDKACNDAHGSCMSNCGDGTRTGAGGLPEPDPNYAGCVSTCNSNLCSCLDSCGSECKR